jgi:L-threonine kinase
LTGERPAGVGSAPGTCGEFVQGVLGDDAFMITFPIDVRTTAYVMGLPEPGVRVWPPHKVKARTAVEKLVARTGLDVPGLWVRLTSPLPEGKGYASSSADIVAACRAVADYLGTTVRDADLCALATEIEPSDAVMFEHPVVFEFRTGRVLRDPGQRPALQAVMIDIGGSVPTTSFTRLPYTAAERAALRDAHDLAIRGLETGDLTTLGAAATISSRVNQPRHRKPALEQLVDLTHDLGGYGVSVAHTGTILALLFDETERVASRRIATEVTAVLPNATVTTAHPPRLAERDRHAG